MQFDFSKLANAIEPDWLVLIFLVSRVKINWPIWQDDASTIGMVNGSAVDIFPGGGAVVGTSESASDRSVAVVRRSEICGHS